MRRRTKWIALGLVVAMCATATVGAVSMAEEQSDPVETVSEEEAVEAEAPEADVTEEEIQETEAAEEAEDADEAEEAVESDADEETEAAEDYSDAETEEAEEDVIEYVAIPYDTEDVWGQIAITNSDVVETALNIRGTADEDGEIIGFLYRGAAVWVIDEGDEWAEIYSNGLTGYVQKDYLLFGDDVEEIADYYSVEGVRAEWDGVVVYSSTEGLTEIGEMNTGDSYRVIDDEDEHWIEIQYDEDETGFVSADDVSFVMLFESATPKEGERIELADVEEESTEEESETDEEIVAEEAEAEEKSEDSNEETADTSDTVYEEEYDTSGDSGYYEETYVEEYSTPSYSYESYYSYDSSSDYSTDYSNSSSSYSTSSDSDTYTYSSSSSSDSSSTQTEAVTTEAEEEGTTISSENVGGAYYDANTDTYYDENGVAVASYSYYEDDEYDDEYYEEEYYEEEYYEEDTVVEDDYTVYESDSYVEDVYVEDYSEGVSYSSDDSTLMASLIYCEAGNQPYEGMVAVGAVVMNRVDSSSFPDTISDVIYQSGQFTPAYNGMLDSALSTGVGDVYYSAADDAMSGVDPTDGALYFNTSHGSGEKIGDHWFY